VSGNRIGIYVQDLFGSGQGPVTGSYENNEFSGCIKYEESFDQVSDYSLL
jgi:hypothetical protein